MYVVYVVMVVFGVLRCARCQRVLCVRVCVFVVCGGCSLVFTMRLCVELVFCAFECIHSWFDSDSFAWLEAVPMKS